MGGALDDDARTRRSRCQRRDRSKCSGSPCRLANFAPSLSAVPALLSAIVRAPSCSSRPRSWRLRLNQSLDLLASCKRTLPRRTTTTDEAEHSPIREIRGHRKTRPGDPRPVKAPFKQTTSVTACYPPGAEKSVSRKANLMALFERRGAIGVVAVMLPRSLRNVRGAAGTRRSSRPRSNRRRRHRFSDAGRARGRSHQGRVRSQPGLSGNLARVLGLRARSSSIAPSRRR